MSVVVPQAIGISLRNRIGDSVGDRTQNIWFRRPDIPTKHTCFIQELTYPALVCLHLALDFIIGFSVHDSLPTVYVNRESFFIFLFIVDSSVDPYRSHHLAGLSPSTSHPPLGERPR